MSRWRTWLTLAEYTDAAITSESWASALIRKRSLVRVQAGPPRKPLQKGIICSNMKRAGKRFPALLLQPYCNPDGAELQHASERRFHRIGGTVLHVGQDMGVDVEGDGYGGVA